MAEPAPERVRVVGPLASFADGFRVALVEQGYSLWSVQFQLLLVAHVSRWMQSEGLEAAQLTSPVVERFLVERRRQGYVTKLSPKGIHPLLAYLDGLGVLPASERVCTPVDRLVGAFRRYLLEERALTAGSAVLYQRVARQFLEERSDPLADDLARLSAAEVNAFVLREARRRGRASALTMVCALRSLLRYLHVRGLIATRLATAVPSIPNRREDLPRGLASGQVRRLLDGCDRATTVGCRDFAILTLLSRLGLRRGEVAGLEFDDLDWRAGEIAIRGKGSRLDRLPLVSDVGEALADYLCRGRPAGFGRTVFLSSCAPRAALSSAAVSSVVVRACERAGIAPVSAHALRHTLASELLRRGAALPEVGQVLRHQNLQTTAMYAKVDRAALAGLALPWPGSQR
ncbi:MAG TPA: tyrosine-type recombinase/integrase [Solirubrobacteraceae bacterium]|nr:tyrosine-type recombinase/integrase [Solirubrobacteraceae bacterium]